jgi:hypothetical protein
MTDREFPVREAVAADLPAISRVRTSVRENLATVEQLEKRGITNESVAASFLADSKGWVAVDDEAIVLGDGGPRHQATVAALVKGGASLDLADGQGVRPLSLAGRRGYARIAEILEQAGAKP